MNALRHAAFAFIATAGLFANIAAARADADQASQYVQRLGDQALSIITSKITKDQKQVKLEKLFVESVDFAWVGRFVMGRFWRQASVEQQQRFLKEYQKFLTLHYTSRFTDYASGSFKVTGTRDDGEGEFTVSLMLSSGDAKSEPVLVDYRVRQQQGGGFKIFDVIVEGVSLITTQRSEFASVIGQNGVDYLINQLATKSKAGAVDAAIH